jgi:hypothetical protein
MWGQARGPDVVVANWYLLCRFITPADLDEDLADPDKQ